MVKLFTNEKEVKRAIKAAVDQFRKVLKKDEIYINNMGVLICPGKCVYGPYGVSDCI